MHRVLVAVFVAGALLAACKPAAEEAASKISPAAVEPIGATGISKLTLTEKAVQRLGITTSVVGQRALKTGALKTVPYGAVIYDRDGKTWAYTNPQPLVFVRESLTVDYIAGGVAFLRAGPALGTKVVTVGAAELYGAEFGVGA